MHPNYCEICDLPLEPEHRCPPVWLVRLDEKSEYTEIRAYSMELATVIFRHLDYLEPDVDFVFYIRAQDSDEEIRVESDGERRDGFRWDRDSEEWAEVPDD